MEQQAAADTVVLIHGLRMTPLSWEHRVTWHDGTHASMLVVRKGSYLTPFLPLASGTGAAGMLMGLLVPETIRRHTRERPT
jgi:hypothetical protein